MLSLFSANHFCKYLPKILFEHQGGTHVGLIAVSSKALIQVGAIPVMDSRYRKIPQQGNDSQKAG
jgi:hypothetical protein